MAQSTGPAEKVRLDTTEADIKADAAQESLARVPNDATIIDVAPPEPEESKLIQQNRRKADKDCIKCFKRWEKPLVATPFTIAMTIMGASWSTQGGSEDIFNFNSPSYVIFILAVFVNFYISVVAILLYYFLPDLYRVFLVAAFFSGLFSLTILFSALLPSQLYGIPWTFFGFVLLTCLILGVYGWTHAR